MDVVYVADSLLDGAGDDGGCVGVVDVDWDLPLHSIDHFVARHGWFQVHRRGYGC